MPNNNGWTPTGNLKGKKFTRTVKGSGFEKDNPYAPWNKQKQQGQGAQVRKHIKSLGHTIQG